ncbi:Fic family protein [Pseudobutyrivibrio xylanivorans]|uniref:Fic/DOC family protein n=1 Tax=Pseudobutyrivibrio xylanivorans DSM 14809 TaxID=1123012 RepID=A0A1M6FR32_PSEXY|nr:Fic family protein [Pseudobutyrivibrio xylanivorans]SHJ00113.1 Fic/DOC family protein [Pseudobutyrivibrio xylanivorans DSM 14809]
MDSNFNVIQKLLQERADYQARLNLIPYDGSPEVKENSSGKYLYIRKRVNGRLTSTYVDVYSDDLYQLLLRNTKEARELKKQIRRVDKELAANGYTQNELSPEVISNLDFARANMKSNIYDQAVLEGVATTFQQTEEIIENGTVNGMTADDVQKILNLKHAWEFILDNDVIQADSNYYLLCHIAKLVNGGFFHDGGRIRGVPVSIGGTKYVPPLPIESQVIERINDILKSGMNPLDIAIELCMYCMRTQIFVDGNKRASVIFANHYMISHGLGLIVIPENYVPEFKKKLVAFYESADITEISDFLKKYCWKKMK